MLCFCLVLFLFWMLIESSSNIWSCWQITPPHSAESPGNKHHASAHLFAVSIAVHLSFCSQIFFRFMFQFVLHYHGYVPGRLNRDLRPFPHPLPSLVHVLTFPLSLCTVELLFESLPLSLFGLQSCVQTALVLCNPLLLSLPFLTLCHQRKRLPARL